MLCKIVNKQLQEKKQNKTFSLAEASMDIIDKHTDSTDKAGLQPSEIKIIFMFL